MSARALVELRAAGFTLLEVLVAVFIMALILTFSFEAYQGISNAYERVSQTTSRDRAAKIVLDRIERELVGTVLVQQEEGEDPLLHPYLFFGEMKLYAEEEGDSLRFVTQTPLRPPGEPRGGLALVSYGSVPSQTGPGLALVRQEEPLPRELVKPITWSEPQIVVDNVALLVARYGTGESERLEGWDSTSIEQFGDLPTSILLSIALYETDADGQPVLGPEHMRVVKLLVRPFRLAPEGAGAGAEVDCGEGVSVEECMGNFADEIAQASPALATALGDARAQVSDQCWNSDAPSPALQRLKVLMGGIAGFDASACP